jgi:hypothetical protein
MVCDISTLHIGCISAANQLSVFVDTESLNFIYLIFLYVQKQTSDQLLICYRYETLKSDKVTELAYLVLGDIRCKISRPN